jgi:hypothetical protein
MLRILHCLDNRLTDVGKVVSLTHRPHFTPQKHLLLFTSVRGQVNPRATVRLEGISKWKQLIDLIETRTRDLLAWSTVPQPLRYRVRFTYLDKLQMVKSATAELT